MGLATTEKPIIVHAREAFLINRKDLPRDVRERLVDKFRFMFYDEKVCNKCENREDRHNEICDTCAAFGGGAELATQVKIGDRTFLKTPIGNKIGLTNVLSSAGIDYKIKRHHPDNTMGRRIKFIGDLRDHQPPAVKAILEKKRGVLRSPPRSGKTVMATAAICKIGKKTIIMASQREWLLGFKETFVGSRTQEPLTNCRESQIGFAKRYEDFLKYDICLVTVQTFYSEKGQRLLRKIRDMFSVLVIDECFPAGTLVETDRGEVPIEDIARNFQHYRVLSFNHATMTWEFKRVTNSWERPTKKRLLKITTETGTIVCTEDHKIWSEARQTYVKASELQIGEALLDVPSKI